MLDDLRYPMGSTVKASHRSSIRAETRLKIEDCECILSIDLKIILVLRTQTVTFNLVRNARVFEQHWSFVEARIYANY